MSYLIYYGPDWPPPPEPAEHEPMTLGQKCIAWTVFVAIVWAAGALILHALDPKPRGPVSVVIWQDDTPARGHTTDVTTTLPAHPNGASRGR